MSVLHPVTCLCGCYFSTHLAKEGASCGRSQPGHSTTRPLGSGADAKRFVHRQVLSSRSARTTGAAGIASAVAVHIHGWSSTLSTLLGAVKRDYDTWCFDWMLVKTGSRVVVGCAPARMESIGGGEGDESRALDYPELLRVLFFWRVLTASGGEEGALCRFLSTY